LGVLFSSSRWPRWSQSSFAYIITRPLGASFADWLAVPANQGGLNPGKGTISVALWILILAFVAYLAMSRRDVEPRTATRSSAATTTGCHRDR